MNVLFLSWSGDRSKKLASAVREMLEALAPGEVTAQLSADIAKGEPWSDALLEQLRTSTAVLICLTPEAIASTWITFEAGFIKGNAQDARVFTLLHEVAPDQVPGPLQPYQSTSLEESDVRRLLTGILGEEAAGDSWESAWKSFEKKMEEMPRLQLDDIEPDIENWFRRKTFDEPVDQCMDQSWLDRYAGAVETRERLRALRGRVDASGRGFSDEVHAGLLAAVDSYATAIKGLLVIERARVPTARDGRLAFDSPGDLAALEERRKRVKALLHAGIYLRPFAQPEAFRFERMETHAERKDLVHAKRTQLIRDRQSLTAAMVSTWRTSEWQFDRIAAYLVDDMSPPVDPKNDPVDTATLELEKAKAIDGVTLMPFHYSLKPVARALAAGRLAPGDALDRLIDDAKEFLKPLGNSAGPDAIIAQIETRLGRPEDSA